MLRLTPYGMAFLNKEGMDVNAFGQVRQKEQGKVCQDWAEKPQNLDGKMRQIGEMRDILNTHGYLLKKRREKAKKDLSNYVGQAWYGYLSGDRYKFADLNRSI